MNLPNAMTSDPFLFTKGHNTIGAEGTILDWYMWNANGAQSYGSPGRTLIYFLIVMSPGKRY